MFEDIQRDDPSCWQSKQAAYKIAMCCQKALSHGYVYVWIDTCCIDKSSSAELSEAINSMYQWYEMAGVCYAYLDDATSLEDLEQAPMAYARMDAARDNCTPRGQILQCRVALPR
jgi:hypothetical protein